MCHNQTFVILELTFFLRPGDFIFYISSNDIRLGQLFHAQVMEKTDILRLLWAELCLLPKFGNADSENSTRNPSQSSESDCIWKQGLFLKGDKVKMRPLGCALS